MDSMHQREPSRSTPVLVVTSLFLTLSSIFVFFRVVSRLGVVKQFTLDDYFILAAWGIAFGLSFAICYGTSVGLGRHQYDLPLHWEPTLKKCSYVFSVLYNPALMATKTSILTFYLRLSMTERIFRWACYATLFVVNAAGIALTFLNIFQCRPISAAFATPVPDSAKCENIITLYLSSAPVNIITDLAIIFLPMPILTAMRLPRKQKIILIFTFGAGFFVAVVDVIRIAYLQEAATARLTNVQTGNTTESSGALQRNDTDVSWYASLSYMWSAVEVNLGIMCACVPALKPLVSRYLPNMIRDINIRKLSSNRTRQDSAVEKVDSMDVASSESQHIGTIDDVAARKDDIEMTQNSRSSNGQPSEQGDGSMDLMDFLTTPDMTSLPQPPANADKIQPHHNPQAFFDFVNMKQKKSMVDMTVRESVFPITMVTVLFLVWGIAYGFLDSLNMQFQKAAHMTTAQTIGIHSAYFGGYAVATLTFGRLCLKHWGFKACYVVGLCLYSCGVLIFWPSAVLTSFPAFLVSNFIVGLGLSTLEIAANPFVALCGPQEYMELRLNLSQGVQAIGSVVSPLLASKVLFKSTESVPSLIDVQWTYLGIALVGVALAVAYFYVPLPEATDGDFERVQGRRYDGANIARISGVRIVFISLALGVFAQFFYVGAQESVSTSFSAYIKQAFHSPINTTAWSAIGHTCFAGGRFFAAFANYWIKARYLLLFFFAGAVALSAVAMKYSGTTPQVTIMLLFFFEGPIFALIFASALRGLGKHTKDGAAVLTAAISGGAAWPPIMWAIARDGHTHYQHAYVAIVVALAVGMLYPIWQCVHPVARKLADPVPRDDTFNFNQVDPRSSTSSPTTRRQNSVLPSFKFKRRKGSVQHVEQATNANASSS